MKWTKLGGASLSCAFALVTVAVTGAAQAQSKANANCPPGAFCEEASLEPPSKAPPPPKTDQSSETDQEGMSEPVAEDPKESEPAETHRHRHRHKRHRHSKTHRRRKKRAEKRAAKAKAAQGPITVVIPSTDKARVYVIKTDPNGGPPRVTHYEAGQEPGASKASKPESDKAKVNMKRRRRRRWGLNMHATGMFLPGHDLVDVEPGMAGAGLSFRYRPVSVFALDIAADVLVGTDGNGFDRREVPLSFSGMIFPFKGFLQPYVSLGLNTAFARVESTEYTARLAKGTEGQYNYVGAQAGLGLELRLTGLIGLNIEGMGFVRKRVDSDAKAHPEFIDIETGEASNTSTGGMLRAGLSFWW